MNAVRVAVRVSITLAAFLLVILVVGVRPGAGIVRAKTDESWIYLETLSAGAYHSCAVKSDGTLACWGWDVYGQSTPPGGAFTQVSSGSNHSWGLKSDGTLACWGLDNWGQ